MVKIHEILIENNEQIPLIQPFLKKISYNISSVVHNLFTIVIFTKGGEKSS